MKILPMSRPKDDQPMVENTKKIQNSKFKIQSKGTLFINKSSLILNFAFCTLNLIIVLICISSILASKASAQDNGDITIPNVTPYYIIRRPYNNPPATVLNQHGKKAANNSPGAESFFSPKNLLTTVIPGVAGGLSLIGGGIFTWVKVTKKKRAFRGYLQKIDVACDMYAKDKKEKPNQQSKLLANLKENLKQIQEEVELAAANKNIDQEHVTVILHHIQKKLEALG